MKNKRAAVYSSRAKGTPLSIIDGLRNIGFNVQHRGADAYRAGEAEQFDIVFVSGLHGQCRQIVADYEKNGVPVVIHDLGRVRKDLRHVYLGIGGLHWLPKKADDKRLRKIQFNGSMDRPESKHILVLGQKGDDQSHQMSNAQLDDMYNGIISEIKKYTDIPIIFRPHPLRSYTNKIKGAKVVTPESESLHEALDEAHAAVMHSSTAGLTALEMGVPIFCADDSFLAPISCGSIDNLEHIAGPENTDAYPSGKDIKEFFKRVSYTQWSIREVVSGEALSYIISQTGIEMPKTATDNMAPAPTVKEAEEAASGGKDEQEQGEETQKDEGEASSDKDDTGSDGQSTSEPAVTDGADEVPEQGDDGTDKKAPEAVAEAKKGGAVIRVKKPSAKNKKKGGK